MNQYKYRNTLINKKQNSNFKVYDSNFITQIDALFEYELFKNEIHDNKRAYNVHEHRKVPFDEEVRHGKRRNYKLEEKNFNKNTYDKRRSVSYDSLNKNRFKDNWNTDIEKNKDKILLDLIRNIKVKMQIIKMIIKIKVWISAQD